MRDKTSVFASIKQSFMGKSSELKWAISLALLLSILVFLLVAWSIFSDTQQPQTDAQIKLNSQQVTTVDRPSLFNSSEPRQKISTQQTDNKPKVKNTKPSHMQRISIGQGNYYVQVGAFEQPKLARLMQDKMQKHYKHAKIVARQAKQAVWVGPVITKADAQRLQKHIQRTHNIKGFITSEK